MCVEAEATGTQSPRSPIHTPAILAMRYPSTSSLTSLSGMAAGTLPPTAMARPRRDTRTGEVKVRRTNAAAAAAAEDEASIVDDGGVLGLCWRCLWENACMVGGELGELGARQDCRRRKAGVLGEAAMRFQPA